MSSDQTKKEQETNYLSIADDEKEMGDFIYELHQPFKVFTQESSYYSIAWRSFKSRAYKDMVYQGKQIVYTTQDKFWTIFFVFIIALTQFFVLIMLCYGTVENTKKCEIHGLQIIIQMILVFYLYIIMYPEIQNGIYEFKYATMCSEQMGSKWPVIIGMIQAYEGIFVYFVSIFVLSQRSTVLDLCTKFACVVIISKFDDFFAGYLIREKIILDKDKDKYKKYFTNPAYKKFDYEIRWADKMAIMTKNTILDHYFSGQFCKICKKSILAPFFCILEYLPIKIIGPLAMFFFNYVYPTLNCEEVTYQWSRF